MSTIAIWDKATEASLVVGTEKFETDINAKGKFYFAVDLSNLQGGDAIRVSMYQMELTSGTTRIVAQEDYYGPYNISTAPQNKMLGPIPNGLTDAQSIRCSLLQFLGTARSVAWQELAELAPSHGTVVAATSNTIDLATSEPAVDGVLTGSIVMIETGDGGSQWRYVLSYTSANRRCTVEPWSTIPTTASKYTRIGE